MKKRTTLLIFVFVCMFVIVTSTKYNFENNNKYSPLFLANVEAIANKEIDFGTQYNNETTCRSNGGYWNMALICDGGGVNSVKCDIAGQLVISGVTIFNATYQKGKTYNVAWERYACKDSKGNCCKASSQGVYVK